MEQHLLHDLDLIAAYSEGLLEDAAEAARLVRECSDCLNEYELQQNVKGLLTELPLVRLTAEERAGLDAAISSLATVKVISMADRRKVQRWMRVASVAAATFVLIGLGSVFLAMMGSGDGAATTTVAGFEGATAEADTSTLEATTTAAAVTGQGQELAYRLLAGGDADAVRTEIETMLDEAGSEFSRAPARDDVVCQEQLADREVLDVAQSNLDGRPVIIVIVAGEDGKEALVYDEATCELVELPSE